MINLNLIFKILVGNRLPFPDCEFAGYEELLPEGLTMGTLYIGKQGTGKTSSLARHIVEYFGAYPERAIFVLDWSGMISDAILGLIVQQGESVRTGMIERLVYDELGNPDMVVPLPEFSSLYGDYEEQVQRVSANLAKLAPELVRDAPFLAGLGLREIAPQLFRVLTSVPSNGDTWQVTEGKKLITDSGLLKRAITLYGHTVPQAKWFLEKAYLPLKQTEKELRTYALLALLGTVEARETRARVGYPKPGWTPKEALDKGLMVIVNGSSLINQKNAQHYLFTQVFSLIMSEVNKRAPGNPYDCPFALVMDEVYSLLSIPGMAEDVGMLAPLYRSRKLELYVVLQALSQLAPVLKDQIWSLGNVVCFAISDFNEALEISKQLFPFRPKFINLPEKNGSEKKILGNAEAQYLEIANRIQRMSHRECIMRRHASERGSAPRLFYVEKTKEAPAENTDWSVPELKAELLRKRGIKVLDALKLINSRDITPDDVVASRRVAPVF